jgi:release factor glutamine methyltransferase
VFAEEEAALLLDATEDPVVLEDLTTRRAAGEPLEHLLGWVDFAGNRILVGPGVFVPRQRTALVVDVAAGSLAPGDVVVDLCCGAGALGAALAARVPGIEVHAVDIEAPAVAWARRNLEAVGGTAYVGDLDGPLPDQLRGRVAVVVANAPYVPTARIAEMPSESRDHEPRVTVDGGVDGLAVLRRVVARAPYLLRPGGHLVVEAGRDQVPTLLAAFARAGLDATDHHDEERGAHAVAGRLTGAGS